MKLLIILLLSHWMISAYAANETPQEVYEKMYIIAQEHPEQLPNYESLKKRISFALFDKQKELENIDNVEFYFRIIRLYFDNFIRSSLVLKNGVFSQNEWSIGSKVVLPKKTLDLNFTETLRKTKELTLKFLLDIRWVYPELFLKSLNGASIYHAILADVENVSQFSDFQPGSGDSLKLDTCYGENPSVDLLIENQIILESQLNSKCKKSLMAQNISQCFPPGMGTFKELLVESKEKMNYLFIDGNKVIEVRQPLVNPLPQEDEVTSEEFSEENEIDNTTKIVNKECQFIGGNWKLISHSHNQFSTSSRVEILLPDGTFQELNSNDLSRLRSIWTNKN